MRKVLEQALTAVVLMGCSALEPVAPPPQEVVIRVMSDPGKPVRGAHLLFNGQQVATTDEEGVGTLRLKGKDGETYDISVSCPEEYQSPSKPIHVVVRRLADPTKRPEFTTQCPPKTRTIVVAVRADGGAHLPVIHLGREVARTDASGAAHVLLKLKPDEAFSLTLDTSNNERLRPQNPFASFLIKEQDDVFTFDQKFDLDKRIYRGSKRRGPVRIGP